MCTGCLECSYNNGYSCSKCASGYFLLLIRYLASAVKDFVLHAQKQMFVRVAVQVDFSL
jgi:hypothetical protein